VPVVSDGAERKVEDDNEHEPEENADTPIRSPSPNAELWQLALPTDTANCLQPHNLRAQDIGIRQDGSENRFVGYRVEVQDGEHLSAAMISA
jgi:hypothetical protein